MKHKCTITRPGKRLLAVIVVACFAFGGCTSTSLLSKLTHRSTLPRATAGDPAVRCLCLWEPAEGTGVDDKPARGVAGQIFFFTRTSISPVAVDGDVRIYLFDDQGTPEEQTVPLHQFDFLSGSWQAQLTSTQFGPAYQLFVPYSRKGHHQASLALRVRLTSKNGPVVFSDMVSVDLEGYERSKTNAEKEPSDSSSREPVIALEEEKTSGLLTPEQVEQALKQVVADPQRRGNDSEAASLNRKGSPSGR